MRPLIYNPVKAIKTQVMLINYCTVTQVELGAGRWVRVQGHVIWVLYMDLGEGEQMQSKRNMCFARDSCSRIWETYFFVLPLPCLFMRHKIYVVRINAKNI